MRPPQALHGRLPRAIRDHKDTLKVEAVVDCVQGAPWDGAEMGNIMQHRFNFGSDQLDPNAVFTMAADHWINEDRARGLFTVYTGVADARVIVFHHDVDGGTRKCLQCDTVIGTPGTPEGWVDA